jgi:GT2 family glycosyltransferase
MANGQDTFYYMDNNHPPTIKSSVDVVIVNFNAGIHLAESVVAVYESPCVNRVIISDNGSTDNSLSLLQQRISIDNRIQLLVNGKNLGFAAACNRAAEGTSAPFLLILNPDCVVSGSTLNRLIRFMMSKPEVGMAGCIVRDPDGKEQVASRRVIPNPWIGLARMFSLDKLIPIPDLRLKLNHNKDPLPIKPISVEAISGALMLARREAISDVGMLDDGYFLHCEDLDWFVRFRQQGWHIYLVPDVDAMHHKGVCSRDDPIKVLWHKHRGMERFFRKFQYDQFPKLFSRSVILGIWLRFSMLAVTAWIRHQLSRLRSQ